MVVVRSGAIVRESGDLGRVLLLLVSLGRLKGVLGPAQGPLDSHKLPQAPLGAFWLDLAHFGVTMDDQVLCLLSKHWFLEFNPGLPRIPPFVSLKRLSGPKSG